MREEREREGHDMQQRSPTGMQPTTLQLCGMLMICDVCCVFMFILYNTSYYFYCVINLIKFIWFKRTVRTDINYLHRNKKMGAPDLAGKLISMYS